MHNILKDIAKIVAEGKREFTLEDALLIIREELSNVRSKKDLCDNDIEAIKDIRQAIKGF